MPAPDNNEQLLILTGANPRHSLRDIEENHRVLQVLSPRVLIIEKPRPGTPPKDAALEQALVVEDAIPQSARDILDDTEKSWIEAWLLRKIPKQRKGEGLPWDAPGFLPPDIPGK